MEGGVGGAGWQRTQPLRLEFRRMEGCGVESWWVNGGKKRLQLNRPPSQSLRLHAPTGYGDTLPSSCYNKANTHYQGEPTAPFLAVQR